MAKTSPFLANLSDSGDDSPAARAQAAKAAREAAGLMEAAELDPRLVWQRAARLHRMLTARHNQEVLWGEAHPFLTQGVSNSPGHASKRLRQKALKAQRALEDVCALLPFIPTDPAREPVRRAVETLKTIQRRKKFTAPANDWLERFAEELGRFLCRQARLDIAPSKAARITHAVLRAYYPTDAANLTVAAIRKRIERALDKTT
jgi:hypothetical protein